MTPMNKESFNAQKPGQIPGANTQAQAPVVAASAPAAQPQPQPEPNLMPHFGVGDGMDGIDVSLSALLNQHFVLADMNIVGQYHYEFWKHGFWRCARAVRF